MATTGDDFKTYLVDYPFDGGSWSIDVPARSWDEARLRLGSIAQFGEVIGELHDRVPANPATSVWVRLRGWMANRFRDLVG